MGNLDRSTGVETPEDEQPRDQPPPPPPEQPGSGLPTRAETHKSATELDIEDDRPATEKPYISQQPTDIKDDPGSSTTPDSGESPKEEGVSDPSEVAAGWAAEPAEAKRTVGATEEELACAVPSSETKTLADAVGTTEGTNPEMWLDRTDRPAPLDQTRPYDRIGGLDRPKPEEQQALEAAVPRDDSGNPKRFPDPRDQWKDLLNGEGPEADPFRANNCLDCSLAGISTWHGEPQVSAPRHAEFDSSGTPLTAGETDGPRRAQDWLGHDYDHMGTGLDAYRQIEQKLHDGGHGSSAAIINRWPTGGSHAWNAFNRDGEIVWVDFQHKTAADKPLYPNATHVWSVGIDREGNKL